MLTTGLRIAYRSDMTTAAVQPRSTAPAQRALGRVAPRPLFVVTVFVGSFLLFQVQPMVARLALPELGGAAAVWNSAMVLYQVLLLAGYAWAHLLARFRVRTQVGAQLALLLVASLWLPIGLSDMDPPLGDSVVLFVPLLLLVSVGPVIFAVSAQAPLMQQWFASSGSRGNPYALYAASNLGSFVGLITYPLLVEPTTRLADQATRWTLLYAVLVLLVGVCGAATLVGARRRTDHAAPETPAEPRTRAPIGARQVGLWLALSAVPSGLMLSTTTHLSTDIMAMPLLWAIPLGLYLLSFTVAFADRRGPARFLVRTAPYMVLVAGAMALVSGGTGNYVVAALSVVTFFVIAVAVHTRLYDSRPDAESLTRFYLVTSVGGALGGVFCGLLAPLLFDWVYEHPILVVGAAVLVPLSAVSRTFDLGGAVRERGLPARAALLAVIAAGSVALFALHGFTLHLVLIVLMATLGVLTWSWRTAYVVLVVGLMLGLGARTMGPSFNGDRARSYFGVYTVRNQPDQDVRILMHGGVAHGAEMTAPGEERFPTTYYGPSSGVGLVLGDATSLYGASASIGVVGLGAGTVSCYRQPGQSWRFFEIDPLMVSIARDDSRFHFLSDCAPDVPVDVGDARVELGKLPSDSFDVLAVDAFSSDAIPMHLMTVEAFDLYDRVVRDDGVVLVHITNRYIDLEPVLRSLTEREGWHAAVRQDLGAEQPGTGYLFPSKWVALTRDPAVLDEVTSGTGAEWRPLSDARSSRAWTDDFASVLPLLK